MMTQRARLLLADPQDDADTVGFPDVGQVPALVDDLLDHPVT